MDTVCHLQSHTNKHGIIMFGDGLIQGGWLGGLGGLGCYPFPHAKDRIIIPIKIGNFDVIDSCKVLPFLS